ncbi:MAG: DUF177 domain-containing protein [Alphaproteobacteria bacterium]|nr:MAG: DUF177 domain-containing protein [Alphaproteobacteria bacterium]
MVERRQHGQGDSPPGDAPEMSRPLRLDRLPRNAPHRFDERATEAERKAIAGLAGAISVDRFRFAGELSPRSDGGWDLTARLRATIVQRCVASLEPVAQRIDETVIRHYVPGLEEPGPDLEVVAEDDEEEAEPMPRRLDLGAVALEAAMLALDPYPRRPGIEPAEAGAPDSREADNPFAALARLRAGEGRDGTD